ncbi:alpha/beta hydrolase [Variovorax ginsengisoli]|uniref:Alpha/beta hydrolase n=1 Tax=Variovorax ginsengisoli TaxID=363844 RepID=A0ABT9S5B2_9BURK|nr:alpha/beta hydrolase [Variovorax ginsengisoli]MDP9899405.1 hypothetical protein [Variovorax ginsengisoli]
MKTSNILAAAALTILAATGAQAETYDGVLTTQGALSRAEVSTQAVAAARAGDQYAEAANAGVQPVLAASTDRARVQAEAVATAHAPNQNLDRKAFVNSTVLPAYTNGTLKINTRQAAL